MDLRNAFRTISIASILFALTTLGSACMMHSSTKVKDDQLGRLSTADREQLIDRERDVNVAKANVDASKVALDEAKQFRKGAHNEAKAAKILQEDVADNLKRAEKEGTANTQVLSQREQVRATQANTMNAKSMYSDKLVDLREAQVKNREAEHDLMEARLSRAQYDLLRRNDLAGDLDGNKFLENEGKADREFQRTSQQVNEQMAAARASKTAWTEQQHMARYGIAVPPGRAGQEVASPDLIEAPTPVDSLKLSTGDGGSAQAKSAGAKDTGTQKSKVQKAPQSTTPSTTTTQPAAPQTAPAPAAPQTAPAPTAPQPATPTTTPQPATPAQPAPTPAQP